VPLRVPAPARDGRASVYHFELPYAGSLELATSARVFSRSVSLQRQRMTWESDDPDKPAPPLVVQCRTTGVDLVIDDGDNAPLPLTSAQLLLPSYALRFFGTGSKLTLLYGADVAAPRYDLALLAPRLSGETANEASLQPMTKTPAASSPFETKLFWIVIAVAAVALLAMLARLLTNVSA